MLGAFSGKGFHGAPWGSFAPGVRPGVAFPAVSALPEGIDTRALAHCIYSARLILMSNASKNYRILEAGYIIGEYATAKEARDAAKVIVHTYPIRVQRYMGDGEWAGLPAPRRVLGVLVSK